MKELSKLNDIEIDIKMVKEHILWIEDMNENFSPFYDGDTTKSKLQITNLENRRKKIIRKLFDQYCK